MAARLAVALLVALIAASVRADASDCALATDCYGCLQADPSCSWCPTTRICSSSFISCNVSTMKPWQVDSCPCTDPSRDNCDDCILGDSCVWCLDGKHRCGVEGSCTTYSNVCIDGGLARWIIAVIIVSSILVVLIPIIIVVICCCCVAGTAAAVSAGERQSLVQGTSSSSATVIYTQPGYAQYAPPPAGAGAGAAPPPPYYPQPTYQ